MAANELRDGAKIPGEEAGMSESEQKCGGQLDERNVEAAPSHERSARNGQIQGHKEG